MLRTFARHGLVLGVVLWCASLASADLTERGENLAKNASFEQTKAAGVPAPWWGSPAVYSRDAAVARTGKASLRYSNNDPKRYVLCSQKVALKPGRRYRYGAWVSTKDLRGEESGATVCVEWSDRKGQWLGGSYVSGVKGTRGWKHVVGIAQIPPEAGSCTLTCYVRRGMTGTAWFDDVSIRQLVGPPLRSMLLVPSYRGRITAAGPPAARVRVRVNADEHDIALDKHSLLVQITRRELNRTFGSKQVARLTSEPMDVTVPLQPMLPGEYSLSVHLIGPEGKAVCVTRHALHRMPDGFRPKVAIDEHRRCLVEGKPFFPLGMYWHAINAKDIAVYADSSFNCLMPYGRPTKAQMDLAHSCGLKVIYSVKDLYAGTRWTPSFIKTRADEKPQVLRFVREFRDHPALLAWYLNDELPLTYLPQLEAHQQWVAREDPNHPTWAVLYQVHQIGQYVRTFDAIGSDPYPIGRHPAAMAAEWTAETRRQTCGARAIWQVPQLHNWANYHKGAKPDARHHTPTPAEVRSMAWQCICEGATGLVFYSWFDIKRNPDVPFDKQWKALKKIAAEIDAAAPALLSVEPAPALIVQATPAKPTCLHWLVRTRGDKGYLFVVNNGNADGTVSVTMPRGWMATKPRDGANWTPTPTGFRSDLRKLDVRIFELTRER